MKGDVKTGGPMTCVSLKEKKQKLDYERGGATLKPHKASGLYMLRLPGTSGRGKD